MSHESALDGWCRVEGWCRLPAAATSLARALLLVEWRAEYWGRPSCAYCEFEEEDGMHRTDCPVDSALTAAGFPDQASRDAARRGTVKSDPVDGPKLI